MIHMQPYTPISDEASSSGCQRFSAGGRRRSARLSYKSGSQNECKIEENLDYMDTPKQSCSKHGRRLSDKMPEKVIDCSSDDTSVKVISNQNCKYICISFCYRLILQASFGQSAVL